MDWKDRSNASDPTIIGNDRPRREPEGEEGAGAQQEGRYSRQAGQDDRDDESDSSIKRSGPQTGGQKFSQDDDMATHGPDDKHGEDRDTM